MPTFQVTCVECRKEKWPMLPERPAKYVCALCLMQTPEARLRSREMGRAKAKKRWGK